MVPTFNVQIRFFLDFYIFSILIFLFSLVQFHPDPEKVVLYSSSSDSNIKLWDLVSSKYV